MSSLGLDTVVPVLLEKLRECLNSFAISSKEIVQIKKRHKWKYLILEWLRFVDSGLAGADVYLPYE